MVAKTWSQKSQSGSEHRKIKFHQNEELEFCMHSRFHMHGSACTVPCARFRMYGSIFNWVCTNPYARFFTRSCTGWCPWLNMHRSVTRCTVPHERIDMHNSVCTVPSTRFCAHGSRIRMNRSVCTVQYARFGVHCSVRAVSLPRLRVHHSASVCTIPYGGEQQLLECLQQCCQEALSCHIHGSQRVQR